MNESTAARICAVVLFCIIGNCISYYTKSLRQDAHCGVYWRCRKRPPQALECAQAHSLFLPSIRQKDTLIIPLGCPCWSSLKCNYAQKNRNEVWKINRKHKKDSQGKLFDKTLLTMIIINNIMNDGNDNQFQIVRGNIYEPRRENFKKY